MDKFFVNVYFQTDDCFGPGTADKAKQSFGIFVPSIHGLLPVLYYKLLSFLYPH